MGRPPRLTLTDASGRAQLLAAWARELGVSENALRARVRRLGAARALALGRVRPHTRPLTDAAGRTMPLGAWADALGIARSTLVLRLRTLSAAEAIALGGPLPRGRYPERCRAARLTHNGRTLRISEWAREEGIPETTLRERLKRLPLSIALRLSRQGEDHWVEYGGARRRVRAVCRDLGLSYNTVKRRLARGVAAARALAPPRPRERLLTCWGETRNIRQWAADPRVRALRIKAGTISSRLHLGKSDEEALTTPLGARPITRNHLDAASPARHDRPGAAGASGPCTSSPPRPLTPVTEDRPCVAS